MRNLTTKDIIQIIPLEDERKKQLLLDYDSYDDARKYDIQEIVWNAFNEMKEHLTKIKYEEFLAEVEIGIRPLTANIMDQTIEAVWNNIDNMLKGDKLETMQEMDNIRSKLQSLIGNDTKQLN